jgi:hypothetical protein
MTPLASFDSTGTPELLLNVRMKGGEGFLNKELNNGVVAGIIVVVVLIVAVVAWKVLAPPGPAGIKSFDKASLKVMQEKHAQSAQEIQQQQRQLLQQRGGGG